MPRERRTTRPCWTGLAAVGAALVMTACSSSSGAGSTEQPDASACSGSACDDAAPEAAPTTPTDAAKVCIIPPAAYSYFEAGDTGCVPHKVLVDAGVSVCGDDQYVLVCVNAVQPNGVACQQVQPQNAQYVSQYCCQCTY